MGVQSLCLPLCRRTPNHLTPTGGTRIARLKSIAKKNHPKQNKTKKRGGGVGVGVIHVLVGGSGRLGWVGGGGGGVVSRSACRSTGGRLAS